MNTSEAQTVHGAIPESFLGGIASGSVTEGIGAIGTIILAIIGLAGVFANIVAAVATIVIGGVFLMEGVWGSAAARRLSQFQGIRPTLGVANGVTAGFFGGLAGIVLGILALFRAGPGTTTDMLIAVAVLVYGASLLVGGGALSRLTAFPSHDAGTASMAMGSGSLLVGLAAVVLGILAVIGLVPMTLVLVALLSLGGGALFSGSSIYSEAVQLQ